MRLVVQVSTDVDAMHDPDPSRPNPSNAALWHASVYLFTGRRASALPIPRMSLKDPDSKGENNPQIDIFRRRLLEFHTFDAPIIVSGVGYA